MSFILYLHGFKSSPASHKAQISKAYFEREAPKTELIIPQLPTVPSVAVSLCREIIHDRGVENLKGIIGSSLGGYYALNLSHHFSVKAVLINPAVRPYDLLSDYLGENENYHTGEKFVVTKDHMDELRRLDVEVFDNQNNLLLLTQVGDETLDFQEAVDKFPKSKMWIAAGGSHEFDEFESRLPAISAFLLDS